MPQKLESQWLSFARYMISSQASAIQVEEMRQAFYAGASEMFGLIVNIDDELSQKEGIAFLEELQKECANFIARARRDLYLDK